MRLTGKLSRALVESSPQQKAFIDGFSTAPEGTAHILEALAGSGKSFTLVRAADRLKSSALMIMFNRRNREEMKQKVPLNCDVHTYHSAAILFLRRSGIDDINKRIEVQKLWKLAKEHVGYRDRKARYPAKSAVSIAKGLGVGITVPADVSVFEEILDEYGINYSKSLGRRKVAQIAKRLFDLSVSNFDRFDLDDVLWYCAKNPEVVPFYANVFIDEAQDTNPVQLLIIKALMANGKTRLAAAGDPNQAIYGWRGAGVDSMADIQQLFEATVYPLTFTRRCPTSVVEQARILVPKLEALPEAAEGSVETIKPEEFTELIPHLPPGTAILARNNAILLRNALNSLQSDTPACLLGRELEKGIKAASEYVRKMDTYMRGAAFDERAKALTEEYADRPFTLAREMETLYCAKVIVNYIRELNPKAFERGVSKGDLAVYISQITTHLLTDTPTEHTITFSTIHKAKGLEWDNVILLLPEKIPSRIAKKLKGWHLAQEKNLLYVAITRAKDGILYVTDFENPIERSMGIINAQTV